MKSLVTFAALTLLPCITKCSWAFTVPITLVPTQHGAITRSGVRSFGGGITIVQLAAAPASSSISQITSGANDRMAKSIDSVKQNLASVRTGRANAAMLDRVRVDYYGTETPLNQVATIAVPSAQTLVIEPYDRSTLNDVEKAIVQAELGFTPNNDGTRIRINIPSLTEDRRKEMLKLCKAIGEEGKVAVRNVRRDAVDHIKKMEKNREVGEDEMKDGLDAVQKMTDKRVKEIEDIVAAKEKEVMTV